MKNKCQMSKEYVGLDGLQKGRSVTYSVLSENDGSVIDLKCQSEETVCRESCFFPGMPFERAKDIAKMLLDNGVESGVWINVLDDMEIDFIVAE